MTWGVYFLSSMFRKSLLLSAGAPLEPDVDAAATATAAFWRTLGMKLLSCVRRLKQIQLAVSYVEL
jgi:hypothetical protein